jgi:hypothetical protein
LTPHVLAADLAATDNPDLRELARYACWYLIERGDARTAFDLVKDLRQKWRDRLGEDHEHTTTPNWKIGICHIVKGPPQTAVIVRSGACSTRQASAGRSCLTAARAR